MSYTWVNGTSSVYVKNFQTNQSQRQNDFQTKTKAYFNPEIVNCEFIKRTLSKNCLQRNNKIHVNPNFKGNGLNKLLKNNHIFNNSQKLQSEPGPSNISSSSQFMSYRTYSHENKRLNNTTVVAHQSRFKKVNVNLQSSNALQCSQSSGIKNSDRFHSSLKINRINPVPVLKSAQGKNELTTHNNFLKNTSKTLVNKLSTQTCQSSKKILIYKSKTKIINGSKTKLLGGVSPKNKLNFKDKKMYSPLKRHLSLSRFVYNNKISPVSRVARAVRTKYKYLNNSEEFRKSKYKIDKRNKLEGTVKRKLNAIRDIRKLFPDYYTKIKSPYKIYQVNNCHVLSKSSTSWRKNKLSDKIGHKVMNQSPNQKVVKIGGILYKSTKNKLTLANKSVSSNPAKSVPSKSKAKKNHIVYVRGEKFILENNGKALRRQTQNTKTKKSLLHTTKRIDIGGVTYIQKSPNVLIRTNVHKARYLVNKAKNKSIAMLASLSKRSSMPCMIYHRFGKCNRHTSGLCIYKHDPKNIAVCKDFLKGNCTNENCLLSHEVIQEKMATCRFFLNGLCIRENCPYLHVKLNKNVAICEDFLQGFCNLGKNCSKRHLHQCPEFDKYGTCSLGSKCHYPHKKQNKTDLSTEHVCDDSKVLQDPEVQEVKYYVCSGVQKKQRKSKKVSTKENRELKSQKKAEKRKGLSVCGPEESSDMITCFPKRIRLDKLPCYIPLKSDS